MREVFYLLFHLLTTLAKLLKPGGSRTVIAENLLLKQQLLIHSRARERAPNLSTKDRTLLGFWSLFLNPRRIARSAIIVKPSTLLRFHTAMMKRKYRQLYSPSCGSISAITTRAGLILGGVVTHPWKRPAVRWLISISIGGRSTAGVYSNCQLRLELPFRQGQGGKHL